MTHSKCDKLHESTEIISAVFNGKFSILLLLLHFLWWERIIMMCVIKIFQNTKWCVSWYKVSIFWLCNYETKTSKYCIVKHTQHHFWSFLIIWNIIFGMQQHLQYRKDEVWQCSHDSKISWFSSELCGKVASYLQDRWLAFI